jgi:predicted RNA methylase
MFETLEQFGITQQMLQIGIVCVLIAVVMAIYWRLIAIGAGMLACAFVLFSNNTISAKPIDPETTKYNQVKVWEKQFMEDCMSVSMNSKSECETIWKENRESIVGDQ